jgi:lipopolysaccharide/colanic/teichoic acid biosynthesis glycosyltransferase
MWQSLNVLYAQRGKRFFDLTTAFFILIFSMPIVALVALVIRWKLGPPVLFRQQRPGLHSQIFVLWKFRTMSDARDTHGRLLSDADRLSSFGRWLRSLSLDELPELLNVLQGHMSLVGPRPLLMQYLTRYTPEQRRRHDVRPGITGWAQVNGRNTITWEQKFAFDVWYVDHISLWLDVKILALTIWQVCTRRGINEPGQATVQEFIGKPQE